MRRTLLGNGRREELEEKREKKVRYEIVCKGNGHGFSLSVANPISQTILYDPESGVFELEVFEQLADKPNVPRLVSRLSLTIRPKATT